MADTQLSVLQDINSNILGMRSEIKDLRGSLTKQQTSAQRARERLPSPRGRQQSQIQQNVQAVKRGIGDAKDTTFDILKLLGLAGLGGVLGPATLKAFQDEITDGVKGLGDDISKWFDKQLPDLPGDMFDGFKKVMSDSMDRMESQLVGITQSIGIAAKNFNQSVNNAFKAVPTPQVDTFKTMQNQRGQPAPRPMARVSTEPMGPQAPTRQQGALNRLNTLNPQMRQRLNLFATSQGMTITPSGDVRGAGGKYASLPNLMDDFDKQMRSGGPLSPKPAAPTSAPTAKPTGGPGAALTKSRAVATRIFKFASQFKAFLTKTQAFIGKYSGLSYLMKGIGKGFTILAFFMALAEAGMVEADDRLTDDQKLRAQFAIAGQLGGAIMGGIIGAFLGTLILPIVGTVFMSFIGSWVGSAFGADTGRILFDMFNHPGGPEGYVMEKYQKAKEDWGAYKEKTTTSSLKNVTSDARNVMEQMSPNQLSNALGLEGLTNVQFMGAARDSMSSGTNVYMGGQAARDSMDRLVSDSALSKMTNQDGTQRYSRATILRQALLGMNPDNLDEYNRMIDSGMTLPTFLMEREDVEKAAQAASKAGVEFRPNTFNYKGFKQQADYIRRNSEELAGMSPEERRIAVLQNSLERGTAQRARVQQTGVEDEFGAINEMMKRNAGMKDYNAASLGDIDNSAQALLEVGKATVAAVDKLASATVEVMGQIAANSKQGNGVASTPVVIANGGNPFGLINATT